jgi:uncharacterized protein YjiS (DUF1127 family)
MARLVALKAYALSSQQKSVFARLQQAFADYRKYRKIYEELDALSDRELSDLGLSRHSIPDVASAAVYGN